jgi:predicted nucleic acid-binding protein
MDHKKVYLDTSVISALFDVRTPERQNLTQTMWSLLDSYQVFISEKVLEEVNASSPKLKEALLKAVSQFKVLPVTQEAEALARQYIANDIFPEKYFDDALHVALASTNGIGYLLSWNFKHLVKVKTRKLVSLVNTLKEYPPVEIIAPPEL